LFFNALKLLPRRGALLAIQLLRPSAGQPSMGALHDRAHHLQIADQLAAGPGRGLLLPLRFEKQPWIVQNAVADRNRSSSPGGIQLARFAGVEVVLDENRRHALAILQALPRHGHQKLHRQLRRDLPFAYLLLDRFRQQLHQCQPPGYPPHAAVELPRQLFQAVAESLLQLLQQPPHLQRGLLFG
jgi:hypothetical protein